MSTQQYFLKRENIELLWEVLQENSIIKSCPPTEKQKVQQVFVNNLQTFSQNSKNIHSLTELNKAYMTAMIAYVRDQVTLTPSPVPLQGVTHEEIQNKRANEFERNLKSMQDDFQNSVSSHVPPTPDFRFESDKPLENLEVEMKKYMTQRNYDVQSIFPAPPPSSTPSSSTPTPASAFENSMKLIKIEDTLVDHDIEAHDLEKKSVTWADDVPTLFSKLKPKPPNDLINDLRNELKEMHQKLDLILQLLQSSSK
jgi:hypothetical protein